MNKTLMTLSLAAALLGPVSAAPADPKDNTMRLRIQVYRVAGDFAGDLSLTEDLWRDLDGPGLETKRTFTFFTQAKVTLANTQLRVDENGWFWGDGREIPFGATSEQTKILGDRIALLAQPDIRLNAGTETVIDLTSEQSIEYFERVHDNTFALKTMQQPTGLTLRMQVENPSQGRILLKDFTAVSRIVEDRERIEGVSLNVGPPLVRTREFKASVRLKPGRDCGILVHGKDVQGLLLIRLRVTVEPSAGAAPAVTPPGTTGS